jgi:BirA family biotin operon repressor/biotin-[acetyl-CoA-carboxylase] ligase
VQSFGLQMRLPAYHRPGSKLGRSIDRAALCAATVATMARRYADLIGGRFDAILDAWRQRAPSSRGAAVKWQTNTGSFRSGTTAGIDDRGALLVRTPNGVERIVAGELVWH